ncbi:MAG: 16S rRNA (cytosine(967)-C(5))-methyltransferase RsmB [bacterium]|nr:16S rRNA (cytosine(967)-C(5))-methyltransferase RsmB [bacterium]
MKKKPGKPQSPEGARKAAWRILLAWEAGSDALEALRDSYFHGARLDLRDKALVTELTQGTVRHLLFLDHTIQSKLDRPDLVLPGPVLIALRLGAYQLIHLHKIPAHAAVKETVQIIKDSRHRRFSSLVNAILRKIADKGSSPIPTLDDDPIKHIELATSTPRWLVERLLSFKSVEETRQILQALNRTPPLTLRVNTSRISRDELMKDLEDQGVTVKPGKLSKTAIVLEARTPPWELKPFKEGLCTVQDEGAQLIAGLLEPARGQKILDACAAPGGKTGHLAQLTSEQALIIAADRSYKRVHMMSDSLKRLGVGNVRYLTADLGTAASPLAEKTIDRILLDVPCSGTGVLRRHPEGKWKKDPETISQIAAVQEDLLVSMTRSLKTGGRLLYTTCSLLEEENEEVVDRFLAGSADMDRLDMREKYPDLRQNVFSDRGELRLWPHLHDCDGFYACLMEKK